jgi:hypothetical protein
MTASGIAWGHRCAREQIPTIYVITLLEERGG